MVLTLLSGYPDFIGKRQAFVGFGAGPASLAAAGDLLQPYRFSQYYDFVHASVTPDGVYVVRPQPATVGPRAAWYLKWYFNTANSVASVAQGTAGTGMTPGTYIVNGTGGGGTGAQISVVVANATTLGPITVLNPGSGYTTAPAFSLAAAGGTPATLAATLSVAGAVVPTGTNLSAEQVQVGGFSGQY